jgi:serine/threonine protein kinase
MDALIGRVLGGRYRVERRLGEGGMGTVYEGEQVDLRRKVAIKVLKPEAASVQGLQRFQREARAAAALRNPHIVQVSDFQVNAGEPPFLVMELLEGYPLSDLISKDGRVEPQRLVVYARQVLAALFAAHDAGIIHRDIKPENVFVTQSAVGELVKLVDFGIAKLYGQPAEAVTRFGAVIGSVFYMSPEQAAGVDTDPRSDVFSLGACMYHALSGQLPFEGSSAVAVLRALSLGERKPLRAVAPHVDPRLEAIVHRALSGDPATRFQSAREMDAALSLLLSQAPRMAGATGSLPPGAEIPFMPTAEAPALVSMPPHVARPMTQPASIPMPKPVVVAAPRKRSPAPWIALGLLGLVATAVGGVVVGARLNGSPSTTGTASVSSSTVAVSAMVSVAPSVSSAPPLVSVPPTEPSSTLGSHLAAARDAGRSEVDAGRAGGPNGGVDAGATQSSLACTDSTVCKRHLGRQAQCVGGKCGCGEGANLCRGGCVPLASPSACGGCGIVCADEETCRFEPSAKKYACISCGDLARRTGEVFAEYKYCGVAHWCENIKQSALHCGACQNRCTNTGCYQGKCQ